MYQLKNTDPDFSTFFVPQKSKESPLDAEVMLSLAAISCMPPMHQVHDIVECSWQPRARALKTQLEEENEARAEGSDGVFPELEELECSCAGFEIQCAPICSFCL